MSKQHRKAKMPLLTVDEVMLLVNTYFLLKEIETPSVKKDLIQELSDNMRKLPFFPELVEDPAFRSFAGMTMCLANVGFLDPDNPSKFGHGSALQRCIFEYYSARKPTLQKLVNAINSIAPVRFPILPEYTNYIGGALLPSYHHYLEHTDKTVQRIKRDVLTEVRTTCGLCQEDLSVKYGDKAPVLLEAHIARPLSDYRSGITILSSDVVMLCPCCHKLAHLTPANFTLTDLEI